MERARRFARGASRREATETRARRRAHDEFATLVASGRRREAASSPAVAPTRPCASAAGRSGPPSDEVACPRGWAEPILPGSGRVRRSSAARPRTARGTRGSSRWRPQRSAVSTCRWRAAMADVVVRDLGSRNGTTLRGLLRGGRAVGAGIELRLGSEVPLVVRPAADLARRGRPRDRRRCGTSPPSAPRVLGIGRWRLECGPRGAGNWVELVTDDEPPAFLGESGTGRRVSLARRRRASRPSGGAGSEPVLRSRGDVATTMEHLVRVGTVSAPLDEGAALFARLRSTPEEGRAITGCSLAKRSRPSEPLLVAVASALVDRGEPVAPRMALARAASSEALILRADLLRRGELAAALALVERVLLRDLDWPGARERHTRWREALGRGADGARPRAAAADDSMTSAPDAPFVACCARSGAAARASSTRPRTGSSAARRAQGLPPARARPRAAPARGARRRRRSRGRGWCASSTSNPEHGWLAMEWARSARSGALPSATSSSGHRAVGAPLAARARARARRRLGAPRREARQHAASRSPGDPAAHRLRHRAPRRRAEPAGQPRVRLARAPRRTRERPARRRLRLRPHPRGRARRRVPTIGGSLAAGALVAAACTAAPTTQRPSLDALAPGLASMTRAL